MTSPVLQNYRQNVELVVQAIGSASKLQRMTGLTAQFMHRVQRGDTPFSDNDAHLMEEHLGLPRGWLSRDHGQAGLQELREKLQSAGVEVAADNSPEMQKLRRANLHLLAGDEWGARSALCARFNCPSTEFNNLMKRVFGGHRARSIEQKLGIPVGWLDEDHTGLKLPVALNDRLAALGANTVAKPTTTPMRPVSSPIKPAGGPIARALQETLETTIAAGHLTENDALELLNRIHAIRAANKNSA